MAGVLDREERLSSATAIIELSGQRESSDPTIAGLGAQTGPLKLLAGAAMDWDLILTITNSWYDKLVKAMEIESYSERETAIAATEAELNKLAGPGAGAAVASVFSRKARSEYMAHVLGSLLLPAISAASVAEDRTNLDRQLMQTAAALAVFKQKNDTYPASLAELTPKLLDDVPMDMLTGKPLTYQRTADGYVLYSMGPNGKDEEGSNELRQRYLGYDVSYRDKLENQAACTALGEPEERPVEGIAGMEDQTETNWLGDKIPADADDHAIRLPLPQVSLPELQQPAGDF